MSTEFSHSRIGQLQDSPVVMMIGRQNNKAGAVLLALLYNVAEMLISDESVESILDKILDSYVSLDLVKQMKMILFWLSMASDSESEGTNSFNDRYVVGSLFTGGHDAYLKDKVIDSEMGHDHTAGPEGSLCWVPGCDAKVMSDDQGRECVPCQ
ncbi:hypothetical protein QYF36_006109 [Acer negundo]|nr:hypothetical protein QYF36_006109 [Acer negundo]